MTEERTHYQIARYLRLQYPDVIFNSDLSGIKLTLGQAKKVSGLRSSRAFPDMIIYQARHGFTALFIELKADNVKTHRKDGELVADPHIREQAKMLKLLQERGYCACFAIGFDEAKNLIDWYLRATK